MQRFAAETAQDVLRVRRARVELLTRAVSQGSAEASPRDRPLIAPELLTVALHPVPNGAPRDVQRFLLGHYLDDIEAAARREVLTLEAVAATLLSLDRYGRRALSRRKRAIREFVDLTVDKTRVGD
jgi:hypothetical protein